MEHLAINPTIRLAEPTDMERVNAHYDEVGFRHSNYHREVIAIAEVDTAVAGLGRLVKISIWIYTRHRDGNCPHRAAREVRMVSAYLQAGNATAGERTAI